MTVFLTRRALLSHYGQHVEAVIRDCDTGRLFSINFGPENATTSNQEAIQKKLADFGKNSCCLGVTKLYSKKNFDEFVHEYYHSEFASLDNYSNFFKNCSDAVKFSLDSLFPQQAANYAMSVYKTLFCWGCLGSCGVLCFPVPLGFNSPKDIYKLVQLLSLTNGIPPPDMKLNPTKRDETISIAPQDISMDMPATPKNTETKWSAEKEKQACPPLDKVKGETTPLKLAITSGNKEMIEHFCQQHLKDFTPAQLAGALKELCENKGDTKLFAQICEASKGMRTNLSYSFQGQSLLAIAINNLHFDITKFLIQEEVKAIQKNPSKPELSLFDANQSILAVLLLVSMQKFDLADQLAKALPNYPAEGKTSEARTLKFVQQNINQLASIEPYALGIALFRCVQYKMDDLASSMLKTGANIEKHTTDGAGNTALHLLMRLEKPNIDLIEKICNTQLPVDLDHQNHAKQSILQLAIQHKQTDALKCFVASNIVPPLDLERVKFWIDKYSHESKSQPSVELTSKAPKLSSP